MHTYGKHIYLLISAIGSENWKFETQENDINEDWMFECASLSLPHTRAHAVCISLNCSLIPLCLHIFRTKLSYADLFSHSLAAKLLVVGNWLFDEKCYCFWLVIVLACCTPPQNRHFPTDQQINVASETVLWIECATRSCWCAQCTHIKQQTNLFSENRFIFANSLHKSAYHWKF